mmetsp:Transcript_18875/g.36471  ORF Transcript_18875/g.36471 Transcript_18875/m.36471 type:complete len:328 (+) Transcript_18875:1372-2355(+)
MAVTSSTMQGSHVPAKAPGLVIMVWKSRPTSSSSEASATAHVWTASRTSMMRSADDFESIIMNLRPSSVAFRSSKQKNATTARSVGDMKERSSLWSTHLASSSRRDLVSFGISGRAANRKHSWNAPATSAPFSLHSSFLLPLTFATSLERAEKSVAVGAMLAAMALSTSEKYGMPLNGLLRGNFPDPRNRINPASPLSRHSLTHLLDPNGGCCIAERKNVVPRALSRFLRKNMRMGRCMGEGSSSNFSSWLHRSLTIADSFTASAFFSSLLRLWQIDCAARLRMHRVLAMSLRSSCGGVFFFSKRPRFLETSFIAGIASWAVRISVE